MSNTTLEDTEAAIALTPQDDVDESRVVATQNGSDLTIDDKELAIAETQELVERDAAQWEQLLNRSLHMYWQTGQSVRRLEGTYGSAQVQAYSRMMAERLGSGFSPSQLYKMAKFAQHTEDIVDRLADAKVSWRQLAACVFNEPKLITSALKEVEAGQIEPHELAKSVQAMAGDDQPGGKNPDKPIPAATGTAVSTPVDEIIDDADVGLEEETDEEIQDAVNEELDQAAAAAKPPSSVSASPTGKAINSTLVRVTSFATRTLESLEETKRAVDRFDGLEPVDQEKLIDQVQLARKTLEELATHASEISAELHQLELG